MYFTGYYLQETLGKCSRYYSLETNGWTLTSHHHLLFLPNTHRSYGVIQSNSWDIVKLRVRVRVRVRVKVKVKSLKSKLDPEVGSVMG